MEIKSLGYIGFGAKDPLEWLKFGTDIIGMMPARAVPGEGQLSLVSLLACHPDESQLDQLLAS